VTKIAYMPGTQHLFAISEGKILYKADPSSSWVDKTPWTGQWAFDMHFSIQTPGKVIVSCGTGSTDGYLYVYDLSTDTWTNFALGISSYPALSGGLFSVSSADVAYIWLTGNSTVGTVTTHYSLLVKTPITSFSPTIINNAFPQPATLSSSITAFEVSPSNSNIIWATNYYYYGSTYPATILLSTDGGTTFSVYTGSGHPDGRSLFISSTTNTSDGINDVVYFGSDGGIRKKITEIIFFIVLQVKASQ